METTIVNGGAVLDRQHGAAMPTLGFPLRPRRGCAAARSVAGLPGAATASTLAPILDGPPAGTS